MFASQRTEFMALLGSLLLLISLSIALALSIRRVPEGSVRAVLRGSRFARALPAGWHFIVPGWERVGPPVSLIGHSIDIDAAALGGHAAVHFQILDPEQTGAALTDPEAVVASATVSQLNCLSDHLAANSAPDNFSHQLRQALNQQVIQQGLHVVRCHWQPTSERSAA